MSIGHDGHPAPKAGDTHYRGVALPGAWQTRTAAFRDAWMDGVDNTLGTRADTSRDGGVLKITGWTREAVSAFAAVASEDTGTARQIVARMSGRDRAVLSFWLKELDGVVEDAELSRRMVRDVS